MTGDRISAGQAFTTSRYEESQFADGEWRRRPASEAHAKFMGTTVTVCGQSALSWFKFWTLPFNADVNASARCAQCSEALGLVQRAPLSSP